MKLKTFTFNFKSSRKIEPTICWIHDYIVKCFFSEPKHMKSGFELEECFTFVDPGSLRFAAVLFSNLKLADMTFCQGFYNLIQTRTKM